MYSINMDIVPLVLEAYKELNLKHEPLRLITPEFETPLPPLQPAVSFEPNKVFFFKILLLISFITRCSHRY